VSVFRVVVVESCEERAVHEKIVKLIFAHLGVRDPVIQASGRGIFETVTSLSC